MADVRPIIVRFPALGDTVLLTTLIRALALRYGTPVDLLASGGWVEPLLAHNPHVGEIQLISSRRAPYLLTPSQWAAVKWLKARPNAPIYYCERDPHSARLVARAVTDEARFVRAWDHWNDPHLHWVEWWLQIANLTPACVQPAPPPVDAPAFTALYPSESDHAECARWISAQGWGDAPLVLLQPGHKKTSKRGRIATADHDKHWPAERWAAVIRGVLEHLPAARVLVCGSPREHGLVQEAIDAAGEGFDLAGRAVNLARDLPLPRLMALAERAHSMISVDTGPAHVAAAMDCRLVVLFGGFGWSRWKPRAPSGRVAALGPSTEGAARVADISVAQVLSAWRELIA